MDYNLIRFSTLSILLVFLYRNKNCLPQNKQILFSLLFILSCLYRSIFLSDEGAFLCFDKPNIFNASLSGRIVAFLGEFSIFCLIYNFHSINNLNLFYLFFLAEMFSFLGVIFRISKFFCLEYLTWNILFGLILTYSKNNILNIIYVSIILFNFFHEIPHFYIAKTIKKKNSLFKSYQNKGHKIWKNRYLFFLGYFMILPLVIYIISIVTIHKC